MKDQLQQAIARARAERNGEIGKLPDYEEARYGSPGAVDSADRACAPTLDCAAVHRASLDPAVLERNRVIAHRQSDARGDAYRQLRGQVLQLVSNNGWRSIAMASANENAGKTLTAVNLAISLAQEGSHSVLLADLDLKKPAVHRTLGFDVTAGLIDVLRNEAALEDVLVDPGLPRLVVLPGRSSADSSELLSSPAMMRVLRRVLGQDETRLAVFDLPPLLRNDDAFVFAPRVDATLMVVEYGRDTPEHIERSLMMLRRANLAGTILNKVR